MSDIDTVVVDSLKALDPNRPIREADIVVNRLSSFWSMKPPHRSHGFDTIQFKRSALGDHETALVHHPSWRLARRFEKRKMLARVPESEESQFSRVCKYCSYNFRGELLWQANQHHHLNQCSRHSMELLPVRPTFGC